MVTVNFIWQDQRKPVENSVYYPEDTMNPAELVKYMYEKGMSLKPNEDVTLISWSPYAIEGLLKGVTDTHKANKFINVIVNGEFHSDNLNAIFTLLAEPMQSLCI